MPPYAQMAADWLDTPIGWLTTVIATSISMLASIFFDPLEGQEPQAPERAGQLEATDARTRTR